MTTNLYILIFSNRMIKVGKADNVSNRIQALERLWGDVSYEDSYSFSVPKELVFQLEGALHVLLTSYKLDLEGKDGYTEIFDIEALPRVLQYLELLQLDFPALSVKKGIKRPYVAKKRKNPHSHYNVIKRNQRKLQELNSHRLNMLSAFNMVDRLIFVLLQKQFELEYQYDVLDRNVFLRIKKSHNFKFIKNIFRELHKFYVRSNGTAGLFEVIIKGDIYECKIYIYANDNGIFDSIAHERWMESYNLFLTLPKRSRLCIEDLPILGA